MPESPTRRIARFGTFEVDLDSGELRKSGVRVPIQDQPFRILEQLLARPGQVVTRDELRRRLWNDDTFVDFERGLNAAMKRLRDTLGDSAESPRFIETLARRGYRFIAPVDAVGTESEISRVGVHESRDHQGSHTQMVAPAGWFAPLWRRLTHPAGLTLMVVLVIGVTGALWGRKLPWVSDNREHFNGNLDSTAYNVVVRLFENRTAEPSLDQLSRFATERIIDSLGQVENVRVNPQPMARPDPPADASSNLRGSVAPLLISGGLYRYGDQIEIRASLYDASSGHLLFSPQPVSGRPESMTAALEGLEQTIAGGAAIHFDEFFGGLHIISAPPRFDAYREYRAGLEIFESDYARMQAHLDRALALDPTFWLPLPIKHFGYANVGDHVRAESALARIEADLDRRSSAERLWVEFMRAQWEGRRAPALRALEDLEPLAPQSAAINFNIVALSVQLNRPRAAITAFDRLPLHHRSLRHSVGAYRVRPLTSALHALGEYERELSEARAAQKYAPAVLHFATVEVRALAALGRVHDVERVIDNTLTTSPTSGSAADVMEQAALELRAHGYRDASLHVAQRAVEWHRNRLAPGQSSGDRDRLAAALYMAERWTEAEELFSALSAQHPSDESYLGVLGAIAARRGDTRRALERSVQLTELTAGGSRWTLANAAVWRAQIAALLGERQRAVDLLRDALARGAPYGPYMHNSPELETLADFQPFVELVRPKG